MSNDADELLRGLIERCRGLDWRTAARVLVRVLDMDGMASDALDALEDFGDEAVEAEARQETQRTVITVRPIRRETP